MGQYTENRSALKEWIKQISRENYQGKGHPVSEEFDRILDVDVDKWLDDFERAATRHHHRSEFWSGVWQSFVGSLLFLLALALFAWLIWGFKQNPFKVLTDDSIPRPTASPSPTR